jgi:hypothetical protein
MDLVQLNLDWQKNSKTKIVMAFFFIFMFSNAEMSFWAQKVKKSQNSVKNFFFK